MRQAQRLRPVGCSRLTLLFFLSLSALTFGENVVLKNGIVYRGFVDQDNTIVYVDDGLKRVVIRDSKIARKDPDTTFGHWEVFKLKQPIAPAWRCDAQGSLSPSKSHPLEQHGPTPIRVSIGQVEQAGVHGAGHLRTWPLQGEVSGCGWLLAGWQAEHEADPREIVLSILAEVEYAPTSSERRRVASFLIQAEWYGEAKQRSMTCSATFPMMPRCGTPSARAHGGGPARVVANQGRADVRRKAQQYGEVLKQLKTFSDQRRRQPRTSSSTRDQLRRDEAQAAADEALARNSRACRTGSRRTPRRPGSPMQ